MITVILSITGLFTAYTALYTYSLDKAFGQAVEPNTKSQVQGQT